VIRAALVALALSGCVMPGTHARVVWNPTTKQFEGSLDRSWLAGPVDMDLEASSPDGSSLSLRWHSTVSTADAAAALQAQQRTIQSAVQAGVELALQALAPGPKLK
jgi:hypothetical protein